MKIMGRKGGGRGKEICSVVIRLLGQAQEGSKDAVLYNHTNILGNAIKYKAHIPTPIHS